MQDNKKIKVWYETIENGIYKSGYKTISIKQYNKLIEECENECASIQENRK